MAPHIVKLADAPVRRDPWLVLVPLGAVVTTLAVVQLGRVVFPPIVPVPSLLGLLTLGFGMVRGGWLEWFAALEAHVEGERAQVLRRLPVWGPVVLWSGSCAELQQLLAERRKVGVDDVELGRTRE